MFGMNNVPNLTLPHGARPAPDDASSGYADYVMAQSEDAAYLVRKLHEAEQKEAEKAEEKKKAEADKDTGVFSPTQGNSWSAAGAVANEAEQFLFFPSFYRFSTVA